jgi:hypothetical protein
VKFEMKYEMKCNEMKSEIWNDPPLTGYLQGPETPGFDGGYHPP